MRRPPHFTRIVGQLAGVQIDEVEPGEEPADLLPSDLPHRAGGATPWWFDDFEIDYGRPFADEEP